MTHFSLRIWNFFRIWDFFANFYKILMKKGNRMLSKKTTQFGVKGLQISILFIHHYISNIAFQNTNDAF